MEKRLEMVSFIVATLVISANVFAQQESQAADDFDTSLSVEQPEVLGGFVGGPVLADSLAINPWAFEPYDPQSRHALEDSGGTRYCDPMDVCLLVASVELPSGSIVSRLELDAMDWADGYVRALFSRCPVGSWICYSRGSVATQGTPGTTHIGIDLAEPEVIDNTANSYKLEVAIWRGTSSATDSRLIGARLVFDSSSLPGSTESLTINPSAYEPSGPAGRDALTGIRRFCPGTTCGLRAPIELPSGAIITHIGLDAYDAGDGSVSTWLQRCPFGSPYCENVHGINTTGSSGDFNLVVVLPIPETIDNDAYSYAISAIISGGTSDTQLGNTRLVFAPPPSQRFFETLAIHPYAFEARSSSDGDVLANSAFERYCVGSDCLLLAPVELPSGSVISRLELEAFDFDLAGKVVIALVRCSSELGLCYSAGRVETVGRPGRIQIGIDLAVPEIIDNQLFSYAVEAYLTGGTDETKLAGARLVYTPVWVFFNGFESSDTSAWSSTVQ